MIIVLNGPPRCGKDTIAGLIKQRLTLCVEFKMSMVMKRYIPDIFGLSDVQRRAIELYKDEPEGIFNGMSWREVQISFSEDWMKPKFGKDIFGRLAAQRMKGLIANHIVVSDSGFNEELIPVIQAFGANNVIVWRIYRPGCSFKNDSRDYLINDEVEIKELNNQYDLDLLAAQVDRLLREVNLIDADD